MLIAPFGVISGFSSVTLAFLATRNGLSVTDGAAIIAIGYWPQVLKIFWAPLADATLNRQRWYLLSSVLCAVSLFAMCMVKLTPASLRLVEALVLLSSLASTFLGFAVEGMIAHLTPAAERGKVSGWYQAGNLGGTGLGGGLGLFLLEHSTPGVAGLVLALASLACALVLRFVPVIPRDDIGASPFSLAKNTAVELWRLATTWEGFLCMLLCVLPIATGTASGVMAQAEVASYWHADGDLVALVQGTLGGVVSMFGCIAGGYGCNRLGARVAYAVYSAILALTSLAIAFLPATPEVYKYGSLFYQFATGLGYAAFSAFVLEAIGRRLAATKYNGFASLSNFPIWYMGLVLAQIETRRGPVGMLIGDCLIGLGGVTVFLLVAAYGRPRRAEAT